MSPITDKHPDLDLPADFTGYLVNLEIVEFKNGSGWPRYIYTPHAHFLDTREAADDFVADVLDALDQAGVTPRNDDNRTAKMRDLLRVIQHIIADFKRGFFNEPAGFANAVLALEHRIFDALKGATR